MKTRREHEHLTAAIIGCAFRVHNKLGSGFLESVYERAMAIELQRAGLDAVFQSRVAVTYDGIPVGDFVADIVIAGVVIVELKAIERLETIHEVQLVNYLAATGLPVGLLLNFGPREVEVKRRARTLPPLSDPSG